LERKTIVNDGRGVGALSAKLFAVKGEGYFTDFLAAARRIPRGRVATYGDIAYAAGHPGMARQVAWALRAGYKDVPWQRVVGAGGKILLTGEFGFEQRLRLKDEGVEFRGLRVDMKRFRHVFE
jgi:methylated-DNA-protein-cysteine methyltransferase-like protein